MINIAFIKNKKLNLYVGLEITGHANYAPKGYDIICSAVSALAQTFIILIGEFQINIRNTRIASGDYYIYIDMLNHYDKILMSQNLFRGFRRAFEDISNSYQNYVKLIDKEE